MTAKAGRLRRLKNNIPHRSVLTPSFSISTHTICLFITSMKFANADNLAILPLSGEWEEVKKNTHPGLDHFLCAPPDLETEAQLYTKTVTTSFHLYNQEAKHELKVNNTTQILLLLIPHLFWIQTERNPHVPSSFGSTA